MRKCHKYTLTLGKSNIPGRCGLQRGIHGQWVVFTFTFHLQFPFLLPPSPSPPLSLSPLPPLPHNPLLLRLLRTGQPLPTPTSPHPRGASVAVRQVARQGSRKGKGRLGVRDSSCSLCLESHTKAKLHSCNMCSRPSLVPYWLAI